MLASPKRTCQSSQIIFQSNSPTSPGDLLIFFKQWSPLYQVWEAEESNSVQAIVLGGVQLWIVVLNTTRIWHERRLAERHRHRKPFDSAVPFMSTPHLLSSVLVCAESFASLSICRKLLEEQTKWCVTDKSLTYHDRGLVAYLGGWQ